MNLFAAAASSALPKPQPPANFNLKVCLLAEGRAAAIVRAVHQGELDGCYHDGELWVSRADLHDLLPPGHDTYDPADECCFVSNSLVTVRPSPLGH